MASNRVLIVEDDPGIAEGLVEVLGYEGFEADWTDGPLAQRLAAEWQPNVVLLDLMMPGLDGFGVAEAMQADSQTASIPIVLMTAAAGAEKAAREMGAVDLLCKPFDMDRLMAVVGEHCSARQRCA